MPIGYLVHMIHISCTAVQHIPKLQEMCLVTMASGKQIKPRFKVAIWYVQLHCLCYRQKVDH